jgi:hypothetical protein
MPTKKAAKSTKKAIAKPPKTLTVTSGRGAKLPTIVRDLERALGRVGCRGCRSGIDKIVITDPVINVIK